MKKAALTIREICVFAMLGAVMYLSKLLLEVPPNVHLLACLTVAYTLVYRKKAIFPIMIYVMINGIFAGFALWWIPYLYLWPLLWLAALRLPRNPHGWRGTLLCMALCGAHGMLFGTLYAPAQAILFHLSFKGMLSWIVAGLPWDVIHMCGNLAAGVLVLPIVRLLRRIDPLAAGKTEKPAERMDS